jgi:uncharacterized protein
MGISMKENKAFSLRKVTLRDSYLVNAFEKEVVYLRAFDTDKLLAGFRETAGVDMRGLERYPGWESMLIGGHTLGHYMTACVRSCESANCNTTDRQELLMILKRLADGLQECQEAGKTGYLFGAIILDKENVELQFDNVEKNKTNIITHAWVPWYTMHKLFEGLVSVINMDVDGKLAADIKATIKEITEKLADWVYGRTSSWSEELHKIVLGIEYGGMNDCMYDVYLITGKQEHLDAAHAFDQVELFERVVNAVKGDNILNNHHANTTIPKFVGALKRYIVTGDEVYLEYASHFWGLVVENHTYITGGNSEWEHFGEDLVLDKERTNCNCETCNVYNMLKMTKLLFMITGDVKYADWYENTFINSILSSQNPVTGMTTYFQPMASGYYKVYGEKFNKFWCCTGTGMENFTKLQESFYFEKEDALIVNQYFSSSVVWKNVEITQCASIPQSEQVSFRIKQRLASNILFRLPYWLADTAKITVNGNVYKYKITGDGENKGYALVEGPFEADTKIELVLPMKVVAYNLPDGENTYGFKYGPVVLSALLGTKDLIATTTGVNVTIPSNKILEEQYLPGQSEQIIVSEGCVEEFIHNIDQCLIRKDAGALEWILTGTNANITYVPHYSQHKERYGIYFTFVDKQTISVVEKNAEIKRIDTVQPGYGQYENDELHSMTEYGAGSVGSTAGGTSRYAKQGGGFSYTMAVNQESTNLYLTFKNADAGKGIKVTVDGKAVYEAILEVHGENEYYDVIVSIPTEILKQAKKRFFDFKERRVLTFTFQGISGEESAAVCQFIYTVDANK